VDAQRRTRRAAQADIVPVDRRRPKRPFGLFVGEIKIHDDLDELPGEIRKTFRRTCAVNPKYDVDILAA